MKKPRRFSRGFWLPLQCGQYLRGEHRCDYQHQDHAMGQAGQQQTLYHADLRLGIWGGVNGVAMVLMIVVHDGLHGIKKIGDAKLNYLYNGEQFF